MGQYRLGFVSVTNNSNTVTGVDTAWLANVAVNNLFAIAGEGVWYKIASIVNDTTLTLTGVYTGTTKTGQAYAIQRNFTPNQGYPIAEFGDQDSASLIQKSLMDIDAQMAAMSPLLPILTNNVTLEGELLINVDFTGFKNDLINQNNSIASQLLASVSALALQVAGNTTLAQIAAQSAAAISGLASLSAVARAIALDSNVTAICIYDTSKDDVPDWIYKVSNSLTAAPIGTNTRGSKAQIPKLMIITARGSARQIVIYDGDDPTCPMWWTLAEGATNLVLTNTVPLVTSIAARNGVIDFAETNAGLLAIDLASDRASLFRQAVTPNSGSYLGTLAEGNSGKGYSGTLGSWIDGPPVALTNGVINHVAMTVLPHTPPNPLRFGLPNPTVALATGAGINIIRSDGAVRASSTTTAFGRVSFDKNNTLFVAATTNTTFVWAYDYPSYLVSSFSVSFSLTSSSSPTSMTGSPTGVTFVRGAGDRVVWGAPGWGITTMRRHRGILANSIVSFADDWRATGYIPPGTPKLALSESSRLISSLQSTELLMNGSFATDLSSWTSDDLGTGFAPSAWDAGNGGRLKLERINATNRAGRAQTITTVIGQTYRITPVVSAGIVQLAIGTGSGYAQAVGTGNFLYRATSTSTSVVVRARDDASTAYLDDISFKAVAADYSQLSGNHAETIGTITRAPVAAGAEMACWQDLRTANAYATVPNNSGSLNIGTGDFSASVWYKRTNSSSAEALMHFTDEVGGPSDDTGSNVNWRLYIISSSIPFFGGRTAAGSAFGYSGATTLPLNTWMHLVILRRASRIEMYVNGQLVVTGTQGTDLSNSNAKLLLGAQFINGVTASNKLLGSMALPRLSIGAAPSPAQVAAMYADEVQLFQANAKCLLQGGTSIQDIAYDPDADLTYVAKSAGGTDVFQGLVNKNTILSTTSINKFRNSAFFGATLGGVNVGGIDSGPIPGVNNGVGMYVVGAGPGYVDIRVSGTATANGQNTWSPQALSGTPAGAGETWTFSQEEQIIAGSMAGFTTHELRLDRLDAGGATVGSTNTTTFTPTTTNARYSTTVPTEAGTASLQLRWIFRFNVGAVVDVTIRIRRPQTEKAAAFTSFVDGLTNSDNHKLVAANDSNVLIGTAAGTDIIMPALALRERLRMSRPSSIYDANFSEFNGRSTVDATPTFIGNTFYVPEGTMIDFTVSVSAKQIDASTERAKYVINGYAYRDIGATDATVVILGNPPTAAETTASMDATVVSIGTGWVGVRGTGKAATNLEWFGNQRFVRTAA